MPTILLADFMGQEKGTGVESRIDPRPLLFLFKAVEEKERTHG
jgi:hypothetical protein